MFTEILSLAGALVMGVLGLWKYKDEKKKYNLEVKKLEQEIAYFKKQELDACIKISFIDRIMDFPFFNALANSVDRIFDLTKADRFLLLIAKNGKTDFSIVNVVFEQHKSKDYKINAIARYRNVDVSQDPAYRRMLKDAEHNGVVDLETATMPECLLKQFYLMEKVTFSKVRFLARKPIDEDNDFVIYSSLSTHDNEPFTLAERTFIKTQYEGTIKPSLNQVIN